MLLSSLFKNIKKVAASWNKSSHTHLAKAVCAAGVLTSAADGSIDDKEIDSLKTIIASKETLKPFAAETGQWIDEYASMIMKSSYTGKLELMRMVQAAAADKQDAENVLMAALDVAAADGNIEDSEVAVMDKIASSLGLSLKNYM